MLFKKGNDLDAFNKIKAITLVEMLVVLALGTLLIFCISHFYVHHYTMQIKQRELFNLQQQAAQIIQSMRQHIQHIGYLGHYREKTNYELFLYKKKQKYRIENHHCILFFYDLDKDGCLGRRNKSCQVSGQNTTKELASELFGFKFNQNHIKALSAKQFSDCHTTQCQRLLSSCQSEKNWKNFIEDLSFSVKSLKFTPIKSNLIKVDLTLFSNKERMVEYSSSAFIYLFNE